MTVDDMTIYPTCETCGGRAKVEGALNWGTCDCPPAEEGPQDFAEQLAAARAASAWVLLEQIVTAICWMVGFTLGLALIIICVVAACCLAFAAVRWVGWMP